MLNDEPTRIYVPLLMPPWIVQACYATASRQLAVARKCSMLVVVVVVVVVVVFKLNRSLYPTTSAVHPVSVLILHSR